MILDKIRLNDALMIIEFQNNGALKKNTFLRLKYIQEMFKKVKLLKQ